MKLFYLFIVFLVYISCAKAQTIDWTVCPTNGKRKLLRIDTLTLFFIARAVFQNRTFVSPLTTQFLSNVRAIFPELKTPNPLLVNQNMNVFLQLTSENATIDLTYVLSITGNRNSFAYYIFDPVTESIAAPGLIMLYPLLKDVVPAYLPAGCMNPGYTITLGPFRAGTIIGFAIWVNAWSNGNTALNLNAQKWYSLTGRNVVNTDGNKHVSWASIDGRAVFGFEDASMGDRDFNDGMLMIL
jgi:hypothetical protein